MSINSSTSAKNASLRGVIALLVMSMGFPLVAPAEQDLTDLSLEELVQVKVISASRHLEDPRDAPSAVSIITADDIRLYGWRTLGEVLGSQRGFYTSYDRNYTYLGARGFLRAGDYNSRILLLVNGHRLNENVYDSALLGTEFPLDLDLIDHIEIVRGPGSSLYGANAVFGIINVVTREPAAGVTVEASGDNSSFIGRTGRLTASFGKQSFSGLLSGSLYRSDGPAQLFFPEFASPQTNNGIAQGIDGDRYAHLFGDLQYKGWRLQGLWGSRDKILPTASFSSNFNDPGTRTTDSRGFVDLSYHHSFSPKTDLDLRTYYDFYNYHGTYAYGGTNSPDRYLNFDLGEAKWAGTEITVGRQIGKHRITAGAEYEHTFDIVQQNYDIGGQWYLNDHRTLNLAAAYAELELQLLSKLAVHAGGRLDYYDAFGASLSPRFAVVFTPNARTTLKYIYGGAFRPPNAYESYYSDGVSIVPNPQLRPETMRSHDVVLEQTVTSWLQVTIDGYYNHMRNLIDQVPDPASGLTHFVNDEQDMGRGLEIEIAAKRKSGLAARASYTLADARNQGAPGLPRLDNSPLHMAKLNATLPVGSRLFAAPELLYTSAQASYQGTRVPPSFLGNLTLSSKPLWGGVEFSASCYNVLNRRWFSAASPANLQAEIPQDGRTYRFKVTYTLHHEGRQSQ